MAAHPSKDRLHKYTKGRLLNKNNSLGRKSGSIIDRLADIQQSYKPKKQESVTLTEEEKHYYKATVYLQMLDLSWT